MQSDNLMSGLVFHTSLWPPTELEIKVLKKKHNLTGYNYVDKSVNE